MERMFEKCSVLNLVITISNSNLTGYSGAFLEACTRAESKIIVNYTSETSALVDQIIATKSANSNIMKGDNISDQ